MHAEFYNLSAPKRLALAYARGDLRDNLGLILRLDDRLASIVQTNREILIGQMRIAWWNDVIAKPAADRPKGEPLLALLGAIEATGQGELARTSCLQLLEAWEILLVDPNRQEATLARFANLRSTAIFAGYVQSTGMTGHETVTRLGMHWALNEASIPQPKLSRSLRPLSILVKSVTHERSGRRLSGLSLLWHALTGR